MRIVKRWKARRQTGDWGVVETRSNRCYGHGTPVWLAHWMDLGEDGNVSVHIDPDRDATITPATWDRAWRALGLPRRILVLDDETAARLKQVVPARVAVVVAPDDPRLRELAAICQDLPDEGDFLTPFPTSRARC